MFSNLVILFNDFVRNHFYLKQKIFGTWIRCTHVHGKAWWWLAHYHASLILPARAFLLCSNIISPPLRWHVSPSEWIFQHCSSPTNQIEVENHIIHSNAHSNAHSPPHFLLVGNNEINDKCHHNIHRIILHQNFQKPFSSIWSHKIATQ